MWKIGLVWWRMRHFGEAELESHTTVVLKNRSCPQFQSGLLEKFFSVFQLLFCHCFLSYCMYCILVLFRAARVMLGLSYMGPKQCWWNIRAVAVINSAYAVFRLFLPISLFLFHVFFYLSFEILSLLSNCLIVEFKSRSCSLCIWFRQLGSHSGRPGRRRVDDHGRKD